MKALVATGTRPLVRCADVPEPEQPGDTVIVRTEAFSVNRGEAQRLRGDYGAAPASGTVFGQDIAGRVVAAAADGSGPRPGTRVVGLVTGGGWAERVAVPTSALATLPDTVPTDLAAAVPLAGLTALRLLRAVPEPAGKRVLITGASGGVGHFLTELATAAGASVTVLTADAARARRLVELGADTVLHRLADAAGRYDVVFESVGGTVATEALARLATGGTVLWFGQASLEPIRLDFFDLIPVTPFTLKHFPHWASERTDAADLRTLVDLVAEGQLHPELHRVADWAETGSVLVDLLDRRIRGKAVLTVPY